MKSQNNSNSYIGLGGYRGYILIRNPTTVENVSGKCLFLRGDRNGDRRNRT